MKNKTEKNKKGIKKLFVCACISVLLCMVFGVGMLFHFFAPRKSNSKIIVMPDLVGVLESKIPNCESIDIKKEWVYSSDADIGRVVSQTPYAGARRKLADGMSGQLTLFIGLGEKRDEIPSLYGVDYLSAAAALRSLGARVRTVSVYCDGEDGEVIDTSPKCGSSIRCGDTVTIFVSRKRAAGTVRVPDFVGMNKSDAVRRAFSIGLYIGYIDEYEDGSTVLEQSIPQGSVVLSESYISFRTGRGGMINEREWPPIVFEEGA